METENASQSRSSEEAKKGARVLAGKFVAVVATAFGIAIATLMLFLLVEGASSFVIFAHRIFADPPGEDRRHAHFDPLLGWVNARNIYIRDMWGPGVYFRTNAQGFRSNHDIPQRAPTDKLRVVCSGDSFTQGYGVSNDHAFCQQLGALDPRFEPVNMGQAGYGIDQAFLWYQRDGAAVGHDVHVFALITDDFWRMQTKRYNGYAKPVLRLRGGALVVENTPVRPAGVLAPWVVRVQNAASELRTLALIQKIQRRGSDGAAAAPSLDPETRAVAREIFKTLAAVNRSKGSKLVLLYLPTKWDYLYQDPLTDKMRQWLREAAEREGLIFVDLVAEIRKLPSETVDSMFIPGHWHYTPAGNEWVARMLRQRLMSDPRISARLAGLAAQPSRAFTSSGASRIPAEPAPLVER